MKILQKKIFVILLAVFAVGLVGRNLFWPLAKRYFPTRAAAAAPAPSPAPSAEPPRNVAPATAAKPASAAQPEVQPNTSVEPMNVVEASSSAPNWVQNPKRDPFKMAGARSDGKAARDLLTLGGVLRQTESTLVVLNNRVMAVGDTILGFKVESVEDQCVWVSGPNGREQVEFKYSLPPGPDIRQKKTTPELSLAHPEDQISR